MDILLSLIAIVFAAIALWRAGIIRENNEQLTLRLTELETEVYRLRNRSSHIPPAAKAETSAGASTAEFQTDATFPAPPVIPEMPEIPPGPSDEMDAPPVISPPVSDFAKAVEAPIPGVKPQAVPVPPIFTPKAKSAPPSESPPVAEKTSFEMRLGTYWLVCAGIVMLLTGLAFFANYAYHHVVPRLGPGGKISLLYLASGLLLGAGAWCQRRTVNESLKNYAQVLFAGGLAAVYFTTYAAHHIPPLCVIASASVDGTLLLVWAGVILWLADRRKSEVMALFAVGLAFYSSVITRVGDFTLWSNLVLTIAAVVFLVRNRWAGLSFAGLATSYAGYAFWRFLHEDGWRWATPDEGLNFGVAFLAAYWLVFTAATFLSRCEKLSGPNRAAFLTLNNGAFFGLFILTMLQVHSGGFWKVCLGYGVVLLALAALARKMLPDEPLARSAYLTQGLLLVTLGFISKFAGLQLALVLGVESVVLFILGTQRRSGVLKFFAYAAAMLAAGWCVANLKQFDLIGLWTGAALGVLLIFNAFWAHRTSGENGGQPLRIDPSVFTLLAFACWLATTWFNTTGGHLPLALAAEAVALTFSIYLLRVREITLLGQFFLVFAQLAWLFHFLNTTPPWWSPLALIAVTVGLSHWWQRQKCVAVSRPTFICYSTVFALAAIAIVIAWLHPLVSAPAWLALASLLAVAATIYGVATRAWPLAICGQIFLAVSAWEFFAQAWNGKPEWFFPLAPVAALGMLSLATVGWFARKPDSAVAVRKPLLQVALVYRWTALGMSLCWLWQYVPDRQHAGAFMAVAIGVFAFAVWKRSREALLAAAVYAIVSIGTLWARADFEMDVYWANLLSLLALLAVQQILRLKAERLSLDETIHGAIIFTAGVSLWRLASCWAATFTGGFFITMIWAAFAVMVFSAGMLLRERFHRWLGLGVLAAAVGRVVLVDVWKQETIYRVLTFMALGVALLVIGFIYNKYQEKIRSWL
jgi:uncharacterized membrane protein